MVDFTQNLEKWLTIAYEDESLEFKEAKRNFKSEHLYKYCVAIANEGGGYLVLGITDRLPREVVGTEVFKEHKKTATDIFNTTSIKVDVHEIFDNGKRVLIFIIPSRDTGLPYSYNGLYMMRAGEGLVTMDHMTLKRILNENSEMSSEKRFFVAGERLKLLRGLIEISSSKWIEYIDYLSEASWLDMEESKSDVGESILKKVSELTGCSINWLKHGEGSPFYIESMTTHKFDQMCQHWAENCPENLNILISPDDMRLLFIEIEHEWHANVYSTSFSLDFWEWFDDHRYIPEIYNSLRKLRKISSIKSAVISKKMRESIVSGELFAQKVLTKREYSMWFDDLFDIEHRHQHLVPEYKSYGDWFLKLQESFKTWGKE